MSVCPNMKLTTLDKVLAALRNEGPVVTVDPDDPGQGPAGRAAHGRGGGVMEPERLGARSAADPWRLSSPGEAPISATPATTCWWSAAASPG